MKTTTCPVCQGKNGCEVAAGKASCWCFTEPALPVRLEGQGCLCSRCYQRLLAAEAEPSPGVEVDKSGS